MQEKGVLRAVGGAVGDAFTTFFKPAKKDSPQEEEFTPLKETEMILFCIREYLQPLKEMLCSGKINKNFEIHRSVSKVSKIISSLQRQCIHHSRLEMREIDSQQIKVKEVRTCSLM